ncbi:MAG TPA: nitrous oxide reductase family maturation protein NosD [Bacillota bacterium]|nr:nitrous oxide reductase family maturation protein NosD [Bacillota bacterium]
MKKHPFILIIIMMLMAVPQVFAETNPLQQLIDETEAGETLELDATTYEGNIRITKPLTIIGQKGTVIKGDETDNVIEIDSDDVTLEQLHVTGSGMSRDSEQEHSGVRVMGNNATLKDLTISESFHGVLLNRIDGTTIDHLEIIGKTTENLSEQGNGIHILRSNENTITNSYIEGFRDGVYVEYSDNNKITNNMMTKTRYGMHYMYSDFNEFHHNKFVHNVGGAAIMHSDYITLENNEFSFNQGSRSFGLLIQTSREVNVLHNEFHLNQRGLLLEHATGNYMEGNDFFHNQIGVELWTSAIANVFTKNMFHKNTNHVMTVGGNSNNEWSDIYGNGNYWNEPMIDLDKDGVGDVPFEYTSSLGDLIEESELAYLFLESPAIAVYEKTNELLGNQTVMAIDNNPLMVKKENNFFFIVTSFSVILMGVIVIIIKRKTSNKYK